ncbi:MAG: universal stress protein [Bdellovibrionales bacterium]
MTETAFNQPMDEKFARHQKWGGTYLVVADSSEEFPVALKYAALMANENKCHVGVFYVMEDQGFTHWSNIEKRIQDEQRNEAEKLLNQACISLESYTDVMPSLYLTQGRRTDALIETIENDPTITMLVLAGGTYGGNPGPLVAHFTGKGLSRLRVPVMIVPDHIGL